MKISELNARLSILQEDLGDVDIWVSRDPEGNGFGTLDPSLWYGKAIDWNGESLGDIVILFPTGRNDLELLEDDE